jgi:hypothetical protein
LLPLPGAYLMGLGSYFVLEQTVRQSQKPRNTGAIHHLKDCRRVTRLLGH